MYEGDNVDDRVVFYDVKYHVTLEDHKKKNIY
jgi:hypothetical protein